MIHPNYPFNPDIKAIQYGSIFRSLGKKRIQRVVTFPHLSDYKMERQIIKENPEVEIYAFEKDTSLYHKIIAAFHKPRQVKFLNADAEKYIYNSDLMFDLIFFDYCGTSNMVINNLIRSHLTLQGIFALTEFRFRWSKERAYVNDGLEQVIPSRYYDKMRFRIFKQVSPPIIITKNKSYLTYAEMRKPKNPSIQVAQMAVHEDQEKEERLQKNLNKPQQRGRAFLHLLDDLPFPEQSILKQYYVECKTQKDIAKTHGTTQVTVSSHIKGLCQRVSFLKDLSDITKRITESDLKYLRTLFDDVIVEIVMVMARTTSQSATSSIINNKYKLASGKAVPPVEVLSRWYRVLEKIEQAMEIPEYKRLRKFYDFMLLINSYLTDVEVCLPLNQGLNDECVHLAA